MSNNTIDTSLAKIKEKYKGGAHFLLPTSFEEQLNPLYKLSVLEVQADTSTNGGDVFKVGSQPVKVNGEETWVDTYSPSKPLLNKIATAAGIQFNPEYTGRVESNNKNIFRAKAQGAIRLPDGTYKTHYDEKEINLNDREEKFRLEFMNKSTDGITGSAGYEAQKHYGGKWEEIAKKHGERGEKVNAFIINNDDRPAYVERSVTLNMSLLRESAPQKALTGAMLRVIRALIGMKGQYTLDELKKPFVIARVSFSPDYNDPEVRNAMLTQGMSSMTNVFGNAPPRILPNIVLEETESDVFDEKDLANSPFISDSFADPLNSSNETGDDCEPGQSETGGLKTSEEGTKEKNPLVCEGCGIKITEKVSGYSKGNFGHYLCMNCQKGVSIK